MECSESWFFETEDEEKITEELVCTNAVADWKNEVIILWMIEVC